MPSYVHLLDDDRTFRGSLADILRSVGLSCTEWEAPEDLLEIAAFDRPGCVVLDYRLPGLSGLETFKKIRERSTIPMIMISAYADVRLSVSVMQAGAAAVFEKPLDHNEFLGFIERVCYADRNYAANQQLCLEVQKTIASLTAREREVLDLMLKGLPNKAIARDLDKSVKAVERNRQSLLLKFESGSALEVLQRVSRCPLVQQSPLTCMSRPCGRISRG
jgi:FixJ family two-component response regulator